MIKKIKFNNLMIKSNPKMIYKYSNLTYSRTNQQFNLNKIKKT